MKTFHFTLEAVRTLRQRQEQKALEQYAQALLARRQAFDRLDVIQRELNGCLAELSAQLAQGCTASTAAQAHDYHRSVARRRDEAVLALGSAERRVNLAMQAMLTTRQQREVVDKCFDKQKIRHERDQARNEQKLMDDLASRRVSSILVWNPTELPT